MGQTGPASLRAGVAPAEPANHHRRRLRGRRRVVRDAVVSVAALVGAAALRAAVGGVGGAGPMHPASRPPRARARARTTTGVAPAYAAATPVMLVSHAVTAPPSCLARTASRPRAKAARRATSSSGPPAARSSRPVDQRRHEQPHARDRRHSARHEERARDGRAILGALAQLVRPIHVGVRLDSERRIAPRVLRQDADNRARRERRHGCADQRPARDRDGAAAAAAGRGRHVVRRRIGQRVESAHQRRDDLRGRGRVEAAKRRARAHHAGARIAHPVGRELDLVRARRADLADDDRARAGRARDALHARAVDARAAGGEHRVRERRAQHLDGAEARLLPERADGRGRPRLRGAPPRTVSRRTTMSAPRRAPER